MEEDVKTRRGRRKEIEDMGGAGVARKIDNAMSGMWVNVGKEREKGVERRREFENGKCGKLR